MDTHKTKTDSLASSDKGFTLIELLIVIVILGILAAVTVFAVRGITDKGQTSACGADKKTLETAIESYFAQYGGATIATSGNIPNTTPPVAADPDPELTLKAAGFIRAASTKFNVNAAGAVLYQDAACFPTTTAPTGGWAGTVAS